MAAIVSGAATLAACGDGVEGSGPSGATAGTSSSTSSGGAAVSASGGAVASNGGANAVGGGTARAGSAGVGESSLGGRSNGGGGSSGGTSSSSGADGAPRGGRSATGGGGRASVGGTSNAGGASAGMGAASSAAGNTNDAFGIVSCKPEFAQACKPPIVFMNGDPTNRGKVFTDAVPDVTAAEQEIACTACSILYRDPTEIPKNKHPSQIKIVLDTHGGVAQAGGDQIQFDLDYIAGYAGKSLAETKQEMLGVLQHETVHLYQNYGNAGTGEGLADLVRARTGYYPKSRFRKGEGTWKDAYTASGNFYSWLTGPCSYHSTFYPNHDLDLPYELNKALAGKSGDAAYDAVTALLRATFGKGPDELWTEYQNTAF